MCADFAERLHNDAEMAGIRCAYVTIGLSGYTDPSHYGIPSNTSHAFDAFQTSDRGLIYIDFTGKGFSDIQAFNQTGTTLGEASNNKKVAYIQIGESYGLISLDTANNYGFQYSGYQQWTQDKQTLDSEQSSYSSQTEAYNNQEEAYNSQVEAYDSQVEAYNSQVEAYKARGGGATVASSTQYQQLATEYEQLVTEKQQLTTKYQQLTTTKTSLGTN